MQYAYPCHITGNEYDGEGFAVTFPDVYGAHTGGKTYQDAHDLAEDCLLVALCAYVDCREDLPTPSPLTPGQELITVPPMAAAKLALYAAMRRQNITKADLTARTGLSQPIIQKLLIPDRYSHLTHITKALEAANCRLIVADLPA